MAKATYATIIVDAQATIDHLIQSYTFEGYQALADYLRAPVGSLCVLAIILMGYAILSGYSQYPLADFKKLILRIGVIFTLGFQWGLFSEYVVGLFVDSTSALASVLMDVSAFDLPEQPVKGINGALQAVLIEIVRVGQWVIDQATYRLWSPLFTGFIIQLAGVIVVGFAFFELVLAKLILSVCLALAPLFFTLTLFDQTKPFFDRWLGTLVGFSLVLIFVSAVVGLCLHLIHDIVAPHYTSKGVEIKFADWIPFVVVAALSMMALLEVTHLAKAIGGACGSRTGSALVGGFMGGLLGTARNTKAGGGALKAAASQGLTQVKGLAVNSKDAMKSTVQAIQKHLRGGQ